MDKSCTSALRGAAIIGIVLHHCTQYFDNLGIFQIPFNQSGYALTALFFLFSGYGCYYSFKKFNNSVNKSKQIKPVIMWTIQHSLRIYFDFIIVFVINVVLFKLFSISDGINTKKLLPYLLH